MAELQPPAGPSESSGNKWNVFSPHPDSKYAAQVPNNPRNSASRAPEQKITLVALRLAVFEKLATALGTMAFIWATVVLLGGFVSNLGGRDFWIISSLLITEGTRVFSRSNELEWQQTNLSFAETSSRLLNTGSYAFRFMMCAFIDRRSHSSSLPTPDPELNNTRTFRLNPGPTRGGSSLHRRTWSWNSVQILPYAKFLPAKTMSLVLYVVQLGSALVSVALSIFRLANHQRYEGKNVESALYLFYGLVLAEASVFLVERAYWEYKIRWKKLLHEVKSECKLDEDDLETINLFYYKVYSRCLNESVFSGLDMDLVSFCMQKLQSSMRTEQLGCVKILCTLTRKRTDRAEATRRAVGTSPGVLERLVEMITWRHETEIRSFAATIICSLVKNSSNSYRICAIAGALEGIASLLLVQENDMTLQGLTIMKELARDHRNCIKIGNTSGVVSILLTLLEVQEGQRLEKGSHEWKLRKKSLRVLQVMADTGGESGHSLRKRISQMVFSIRNLKNILQLNHSEHGELQVLAVDVMKSLANDDEIRERIGATGGIIPSLLALFMKEDCKESFKAGEALSLLVLQNSKNCSRILNHKYYKQRVGVSGNLQRLLPLLNRESASRLHAAKILRSLCKCLNKEEIKAMEAVVPRVLDMVLLQGADNTGQEGGLALASQLLLVLDDAGFERAFSSLEVKQAVAKRMVELLSQAAAVARVRRYGVELVDTLMRRDGFFVEEFKRDGVMEQQLERMLDTVSDVENYYTFSGTTGVTRHLRSIEEIIIAALGKL